MDGTWSLPKLAASEGIAWHPQHPVVEVSWYDAIAYCEWRSKRDGRTYSLPTASEWEKAARGEEGQTYPWGEDTASDSLANYGENVGDTTPVGHYPAGVSPYGAYDMAGIVPDGTPPSWTTYFCVDDCDAVAERIREQGGLVLSEPTDFSMGRMAVVADPFGATFSIMAGSQFDDQPPR